MLRNTTYVSVMQQTVSRHVFERRAPFVFSTNENLRVRAMSTTELESQEVQTTTDSTAAETCPRCHTTQPWGQASWCPCCGYYPAVDGAAAGGASWADALPEAPQEQEADDRTAMESIPTRRQALPFIFT